MSNNKGPFGLGRGIWGHESGENHGLYEGEFRYGMPNGFLRIIYGDGKFFFGHMLDFVKQGYGELYSMEGDLIERGIYKDG